MLADNKEGDFAGTFSRGVPPTSPGLAVLRDSIGVTGAIVGRR